MTDRLHVSRHLLCLLGFAALAALLLAPALFGDRALLPTDLLMQMSPWAEAAPDGTGPETAHQAWNPLLWDAIAQFYPWRAFAVHWMRQGVIPLWDLHQFSGTPFLANSQSAVLYPLHFLLLYLPSDLSVARGMAMLAAVHLTLAGFLTYLWLRALRLGTFASVIGGVTFMLSGFVVTWLELPSFLTVACWLPLLFLTLHRVLEAPSLPRLAAIALTVGLILLGGHLQIAFYCLLGAAIYVLAWGVGHGARRTGHGSGREPPPARRSTFIAPGSLLVAGMLGVMLAAPQLLPAMELSRLSHRVSVASAAGYEAYVAGAMPWGHLIRLFLPDVYGNPARGGYAAGSPADYTEFAGYIGGVGLLLAIIGLLAWRRRPRETGAAVLIATVSLLLALGTPLNAPLYFGVPGFSQSGSPARVLVLFCFAGAWLVGLGAQSLSEVAGKGFGKLAVRGVLVWGGVLGVSLVLAQWWLGRGGEFGELLANSMPALLRGGLFALIAIGLPVGLRVLGERGLISAELGEGLGRGAMAAALVGELWLFGAGFNPMGARAEVYPETPLTAALKEGPAAGSGRVLPVNRRWSLFQHPQAVLPPNSGLALGLNDPQGYDSLFLGSYKGLSNLISPGETGSAPPENGNMLFVWNVASPLLPLLAADRIVVKTDDLRSLAGAPGVLERLSRWEVLFEQGGVSVLRYPEALPRAFVAPAWRGVPESGGGEELLRLADEGGLGKTALIAEEGLAEGKGTRGGVAELGEAGPNRLHVRLEGQTGPGMLVVLDNYAPGWRARERETGRPLPVYRADLTFRGVPVSGETGSVEMRYEPASFRVGLYLAMVAVAVLAGLMVGSGSRAQRSLR